MIRFSEPVWVIADRSNPEILGHILGTTDQQLTFVAVFTTLDLAERHAQSLGDARLQCESFRTPEEFAALLRDIQSRGITKVGIDPGDNITVIEARELVNAIENRKRDQ